MITSIELLMHLTKTLGATIGITEQALCIGAVDMEVRLRSFERQNFLQDTFPRLSSMDISEFLQIMNFENCLKI
ncbi:MAG: hypothetical protein DCF26_07660 [Burkholderiales bacterium]|nr:MAG: hypothetical protein DCF26_07660 [Burkholderiales bacterium]